MVLCTPQDYGVERPLMQIVEGRVGSRCRHYLTTAFCQGVGQGYEMPVRLACSQHAQGHAVDARDRQRLPPGSEGRLAQRDLLLCNGGADHILEPQGRLGGVRGSGHHDIDQPRFPGRCIRINHENRQAARDHRSAKGTDAVGGIRQARVEDHGFQRPVDQGLNCTGQGTGGQGAPAERVQALAQGADKAVVRCDDQYARIGTQG